MQKDALIKLRVSTAEKKAIEARAESQGLSLSAFVRGALHDATTLPEHDWVKEADEALKQRAESHTKENDETPGPLPRPQGERDADPAGAVPKRSEAGSSAPVDEGAAEARLNPDAPVPEDQELFPELSDEEYLERRTNYYRNVRGYTGPLARMEARRDLQAERSNL